MWRGDRDLEAARSRRGGGGKERKQGASCQMVEKRPALQFAGLCKG